MRSAQYKYKLNELFIKHFGAGYGTAKKDFAAECGLNYHTILKDCNYRINESSIVPKDRLEIYAKKFDCQPSDLRNHVTNQTIIPCNQ